MASVEKITIIYNFPKATEKYAADIAQLERVKDEKETREKTIISLDIIKSWENEEVNQVFITTFKANAPTANAWD
ncbi:8212_t:CDS:2, partial [Ambispora gerdemannii]